MLKPVGSNHIGSGESSRCWVLSISLFDLSSFLLSPANWVTWLFYRLRTRFGWCNLKLPASGFQMRRCAHWGEWQQGVRAETKTEKLRETSRTVKQYGQIIMSHAQWGSFWGSNKGRNNKGRSILRTVYYFVKSSNIKPLLEIEVFLWIAQALCNYLRANIYPAVDKL